LIDLANKTSILYRVEIKFDRKEEAMKMTVKDVEKIFYEVEEVEWVGDNALQGCNIIAKYVENVITGSSRSEIFSVSIEDLLVANVTEVDIVRLSKLNWSLSDGYLSCFV